MKKILTLLILLTSAIVARAEVSVDDVTFENMNTTDGIVQIVRNKIYAINDELVAVGGTNIGTGNIYYVDSSVGNDSYSGTKPEWAWATLDTAFDSGNCTANNGDIVYCMPGHTETQSATGALFTADVEGVKIICLGEGDDRAKFILSHTGAKIDITADNVRFNNFYLDATGVDSVNTPLNVSGEGCVIDGFFVRLADTGGQADLGITIGVADGDANDLIIANGRIISPDAGAASAITFAKDMENVILSNLYIYGDFSTAGIEIPAGGNAQENLVLDYVRSYNTNADEPGFEANGTANTGIIMNSVLASDAEATIVDAGGLQIASSTSLKVIGNGEGAALPANMTLVDLIGDYTGPDDGTDYDDNVFATLKKLSTYIADGDGDFATGAALPANKSLFDIIGETYTDDGGGDHLDDVYAHLNLIMKYVADGSGGGAVVGANPPAGKSLFDIIGETYTDDGGGDHLDDVYAHLNLIMKYVSDGSGGGAVVGASLPAGKSLFDIIGETYTDDGGGDHLDDVASHLNTISKYICDGDGDFATGAALPSNVSIYNVTGAFSGDGGAAQDDSVKASLDLVHTDLDTIITDTAELQPAAAKCISKEISTITNGNHDLFAVAGGPIKIIEIVGYVTTQIGSEGNLVNYNIDPTTPATDTVFGTDGTALETNGDAVGTLYTWDGVVANDLTATTNGVALGTAAYSGLIVPAGSIELACANDGSVDGAITVYMRYQPLSTSSAVTAAP